MLGKKYLKISSNLKLKCAVSTKEQDLKLRRPTDRAQHGFVGCLKLVNKNALKGHSKVRVTEKAPQFRKLS